MTEESWKTLETLVILPLKSRGARVWVFGSRARGDYRRFSDIDLLFHDDPRLPDSDLFLLKIAAEESDLPIKIDLVRSSELAESYRPAVERERVEL